MFILVLYSLLDDGLIPITFDNYLCNGVNVVIFSLVHVVWYFNYYLLFS
jgi:hypothetical protein